MDEERNFELDEAETDDGFWDGEDTEADDFEDAEDEESGDTAETSDSDDSQDETEAETDTESEDAPAAEADQQTADETQEPVAETTTQGDKPEADQTFELKHLDERRTVNRDEVVALAQKGLDYDRIRAKYDEANEIVAVVNGVVKDSGTTLEEFLDNAVAAILVRKQGIDPKEALIQAKFTRKERELAAKEAKLTEATRVKQEAETAKAQEEARRQKDIQEFIEAHKDAPVDIKSIPQSVWVDVRNGMTLTAAYMKFENQQLKAALAAKKAAETVKEQSNKNKSRSTGSRATVSSTEKDRSDWWYEGD